MDRLKYINKCQAASYKTDCTGVWWQVKWNPEELVCYDGSAFVPIDYRFGFKAGAPRHLAIIHDLKSNTEYTVLLSELNDLEKGNEICNLTGKNDTTTTRTPL